VLFLLLLPPSHLPNRLELLKPRIGTAQEHHRAATASTQGRKYTADHFNRGRKTLRSGVCQALEVAAKNHSKHDLKIQKHSVTEQCPENRSFVTTLKLCKNSINP
jgi:hypothetical protein